MEINLDESQLTEGMTGPEVGAAQMLLEQNGFIQTEGQFLKCDGSYGPVTTAVTRQAQTKLKEEGSYEGEINGVLNLATLKALMIRQGMDLNFFSFFVEDARSMFKEITNEPPLVAVDPPTEELPATNPPLVASDPPANEDDEDA